jgi:hypothetical protein
MIRFQEFINENKKEDKKSLQEYLTDIIDSCVKDFDMTKNQAVEFTLLYKELLEDAWKDEYTPREAIASTKRPGVMFKQEVKESYVFDIDDDYEQYIEKMISETKSENIKAYLNKYFQKFNETYSDKQIFERVKNNYKRLQKLADKRLFEMQYTTDVGALDVDVLERNDKLIDDIISTFSYVYKKRKDRYLRPIKITGKTLYNDTELNILLSNKDLVKITFDNREDTEELKIHINNKLIYHMDYVGDMDIVKKAALLYDKYLEGQNFKINKKSNPFE